jgi:Histone methylation protein DOT1
MQATGADGTSYLIIEMEELKYTATTVYLSVYGLIMPSRSSSLSLSSSAAAAAAAAAASGIIGETDPTDDAIGRLQMGSLSESPNSSPSRSGRVNILNSSGSSTGISSQMPRSLLCQLSCALYDEALLMDEGPAARYALFSEVYRDVDGPGLSLQDRSRLSIDDTSYAYGEMEYIAFQELLRAAGATDGQIFYDLGSGAGKAIVAAALSGIRFVRCVGIEALPALRDASVNVIEDVKRYMSSSGTPHQHHNQHQHQHQHQDHQYGAEFNHSHSQLAVAARSLPTGLPLLEARLGDFLRDDWSEADFAFLSTVSLSETALGGVFHAAKRLRAGAKLLTFSVPSTTSWLHASVYTNVKSKSAPKGLEQTSGGGGGAMGSTHTTYQPEDSLELYFTLENVLWCKTTWGRIRVYILVRTSFMPTQSGGNSNASRPVSAPTNNQNSSINLNSTVNMSMASSSTRQFQ